MAGIVGDTGRFPLSYYFDSDPLRSLPIFKHSLWFYSACSADGAINLEQLSFKAMSMTILRSMNMALRVWPWLKKFDAVIQRLLRSSWTKIDTVSVWAIFVEQADGHFRVRMRSKRKWSTKLPNDIMSGHPLAGGVPRRKRPNLQELQEWLARAENGFSALSFSGVFSSRTLCEINLLNLRRLLMEKIVCLSLSLLQAILGSFLP